VSETAHVELRVNECRPLVGGDMTPDGDELLLKSDGKVMYFRRGAASVVGPEILLATSQDLIS